MEEKIDKRFKVFIELFNTWCYLNVNQYRNNDSTNIRILEVETNEPIATLTTCIPGHTVEEDEIIVKLYSENACLSDLAYNSDFFEDTKKKIMTGFEMASVWKIINNDLLSVIEEVKKTNLTR